MQVNGWRSSKRSPTKHDQEAWTSTEVTRDLGVSSSSSTLYQANGKQRSLRKPWFVYRWLILPLLLANLCLLKSVSWYGGIWEVRTQRYKNFLFPELVPTSFSLHNQSLHRTSRKNKTEQNISTCGFYTLFGQSLGLQKNIRKESSYGMIIPFSLLQMKAKASPW